jgi:chromosome segregation ATPase
MAEEMKGVLQALNALIDMQKRLVNTLEQSNVRFDRVDTELVKANRHLLKLQEDQGAVRSDMASFRSEMAAFRSEIVARVDALARRMDEFEVLLDKNMEETRSARAEIVALENEILNAVQAGLSNVADADDLKKRIDALERRLGL